MESILYRWELVKQQQQYDWVLLRELNHKGRYRVVIQGDFGVVGLCKGGWWYFWNSCHEKEGKLDHY